MPTLDQFQGCLLGLALGDALGAPFEGGFLERLVWRMIGTTRRGEMRWTDDTQMTIDLVESYLAQGKVDQDDLARRFAQSYRWSRGYGPAAAKTLKRIARGVEWHTANRAVYRDGSYGNGAAMRSPILGLILANRTDQLMEATRHTAVITHAHPLAIEGAILLALVTERVVLGCDRREVIPHVLTRCSQSEIRSRLEVAQRWLESHGDVPRTEVTQRLGFGIAAHESCATAVYLSLRFLDQPFLEMQQFIAGCRGDVDTIGAMSGAIWGAANGYAKLPAESLAKLEQRDRLEKLADALYQRAM
jgi:ADP-ribosylglycohydrolase